MSTPQKSFRRLAREFAVQMLYRWDGEKQDRSPHELVRELTNHFEHFGLGKESQEYAASIASGAWLNRREIDDLIESVAQNWKIDRMDSIDRNLLRVSIEELRNQSEVAVPVIINEAIEMAKEFGTASSSQFVNGILDALAKRLRG